MCADRLDGILSAGMSWTKLVRLDDALCVIDNSLVAINEDGEKEISFTSYDVASYVSYMNSEINRMTNSNEDIYMMILLSRIVKRCLDLKLITYNDLFILQEQDVVDIIEGNIDNDIILKTLWDEFKNIKVVPEPMNVKVKQKVLRPLVGTFRLN